MNYESALIQIIQTNSVLMQALKLVQTLQLPQSAIAAGSLRNLVWSQLTKQSIMPPHDVDVVFFDSSRPYSDNLIIQNQLTAQLPSLNWEVKNEVYMHLHNFPDTPPYTSVVDAIAHFPETPTTIGGYLDDDNHLQIIAPYGLDDLFQLNVRATPFYSQDAAHIEVYEQRIAQKGWQHQWPELTIWHPQL